MAGITRDQQRKLHDLDDAELAKLGLTKKELQDLFESPKWADAVQRHIEFIRFIGELARPTAVAPAPVTTAATTKFDLEVDYDQPIEDARKAGVYDWENSDITSNNFPTIRKGKAKIVLHLIHLNREVNSEPTIAELDKIGLRPAETHELLALGAAHPELQRQFPIIALGSVWQVRPGYRRVPFLSRHVSKRRLLLSWFDFGWLADCRFAAVPK